MADAFPIGQIVLVHDPRLARSLGRDGEAAVVLQRRRGGARIGFLRDGGNAWVEEHRLYALERAPEREPLLEATSVALSCLRAEDVEIENLDGDAVTLNVRCLGVEDAEIERLGTRLVERLGSWSVVPYGMAAIVVVIHLRAS